jgi:lactoylglutathione lyase
VREPDADRALAIPPARRTVSSDAFHPAVARIEHIALATKDVECLCGFYQLLGGVAWPPPADPGTGLRRRVLDFCGVRLELFERPGRREGAVGDALAPGLLHLGFALGSADAVDELSRVIATAGYRVLERPHRVGELGRYESVVLDPDGNRIKLTV